jgi:Ni,Fe-hydrogenase I large subunit
VDDFLSALAVQCRVCASTQGHALAALFSYKQALGVDIPWLNEVVRVAL